MVVGTGAVFPPSLVARVRQEAGNGAPLVVVPDCKLKHKDGPPTLARPLGGGGKGGGGAHALPALTLSQEERGGVVIALETPATPTLDVDLVVIPEGFTASGWASPQDSPYPMHAALERAVRQGQ